MIDLRLALAVVALPCLAAAAQAADLTDAERGQIIAHVRPCMPQAGGEPVPAATRITLSVVTETDGTAIDVASMVSSSSLLAGQYGPAQRALSAQARQAVLDPRCNPLPIPARLLGHRQMFDLVFGP